MNKPKQWPFMAKSEPEQDEPQDEQNDSPYCECQLDFTLEELDTNKCDHCGKALT